MKGYTISAVLVMVGALETAMGQPFSSGSTGADGALNLITPGIVDFDPAVLGLNTAADNVFHFTTINIGAGVTVRLRASKLRNRSVVWLATGAVTIAGTLNLSGADGYAAGGPIDLRVPSEPGPGGWSGGVGRTAVSAPQPGSGPGAGTTLVFGGGYGCGGHATGTCLGAGPVYGNSLLVPLRGGSGGGGSGDANNSGGGGAGGGAIQISSTVSITVTGSLLASGGGGGAGGAGASGGAIHLQAPTVAGAGIIRAVGGNTAICCGGGGPAGDGRIRISANANSFTGTIQPAAASGPLFNVPLPSAVPSVSILSINGVNVPNSPTGSFAVPDLSISSPTAVPVTIAATNIPPGTVVRLVVSSETGTDQVVSASPLTGSVTNSTATANIVWPLGVSRVFVRATW